MKLKKRIQGATLLEMVFVLVISSMLIMLGVKQYETYKMVSDMAKVNYNVDMLFQAATYYFYANCGLNGKLAPTVQTNPVALNILTDLVKPAYLNVSISFNPLIDVTAAGTWNGYIVQFNQYTLPRQICTNGTAGVCNTYSNMGTVVGWTIQVSAAISNQSIENSLLAISNANCLSSSTGKAAVTCLLASTFATTCSTDSAIMASNAPGSPLYVKASKSFLNNGCSKSGVYNNYLSYERGPSFSTALEAQSGLSMYNQNLQQFNQMYGAASTGTLLSNPNGTTNSGAKVVQYFYCGG